MNRRRFFTLGLATAATLPMLSSCGMPIRYWTGSYRAYQKIHTNYVHRPRAPYKMYYHGNTLVFLLPELHLVYRHVGREDIIPGSRYLFGGIPESILNKGYLHHNDEGPADDNLFSTRSDGTRARLNRLIWGVPAHELTAAENAAMMRLVQKYQSEVKVEYARYNVAVRLVKNSTLPTGNSWRASTRNLAAAIADYPEKTGYQYHDYHNSGSVELYAAGSYPAGFFDGARTAVYEPATEAHNTSAPVTPPARYAWQDRASPVRVHPDGRVTLNGQTLRRFNPRSFSGERFR